MTRFIKLFILLFLFQCSSTSNLKSFHQELLTLDTHIDFDSRDFTEKRHYGQDLPTQVNLIKMEKGGLDAGFFIVYVGQKPLTSGNYQKAHEQAMVKFQAIHRMTRKLIPEKIELATSPYRVRKILAKGKKVAMIGVENAFPLGTDLNNLFDFYRKGARYISITHNGHNQFGDSNVKAVWDKKEVLYVMKIS